MVLRIRLRRVAFALASAATAIAAVGPAWTAQLAVRPTDPAYQAQSAEKKQDVLYAAVASTRYAALPRIGSAGAGAALRDTIAALRLRLLGKTFSDDSDDRESRTKIFHPFGSVAEVCYEPVRKAPSSKGLAGALGGPAQIPPQGLPALPYTGIFRTGALGIARLSLAIDEKPFIPAIALKLLVDGKPSVNIHAFQSFEHQESRDFFASVPSNKIPMPRDFALKLATELFSFVAPPLYRPLDHVAAVERTGAAVPSPRAPYQVFFRAGDVHFDGASRTDFRVSLATIAPGTVIYKVFAVEQDGQPEVHIGNVRTQSRFIASSFGDRELHFRHVK